VLDEELGLSFDLLVVKNDGAGGELAPGWEKDLG
jgi:hypothetical protein